MIRVTMSVVVHDVHGRTMPHLFIGQARIMNMRMMFMISIVYHVLDVVDKHGEREGGR